MDFESRLVRWSIPLAIVFVLWLVFKKEPKKQSFGVPAQKAPYRLPFGLDLAYSIISRFGNHTFLDYANDVLLNNPGRTVEINLLGNPIVLTDRLENIKAIQADQFTDFAKGQVPHDVFSSILGDSVFTSDGELWKSSRALLDPHVSRLRPSDRDVVERHAQKMFRYFYDRKDGLDVYDVVDRMLLDVVSEVFLGESTESLEATGAPFRDAMETMLTVNTMRLPFGKLAKFAPDWLLAPKAHKELTRYMNELIDKTLAHPANQGEAWKTKKELNLVEDLLVQHPDDRLFIRGQLIAIMMAAKDPAALLTVWALYELSRRPRLVKELQDEIEQHIGLDTLPEPDQLAELTKLQNVFKECTRMYHPLGLNVREARHDAALPVGGGPDGSSPVSVTKGQLMLYSVNGLQRSKAVHGDTGNDFDPSRWERWTPKLGEYIPFSLGPRKCPGRIFGRFQVHYTLVRILQVFKTIEWCGYGTGNSEDDKEPMRLKLELNVKCDKPVICRFVPRKSPA